MVCGFEPGLHRVGSSGAFGYEHDVTFYAAHGDLFAYLCGIISLCIIAATVRARVRRQPRRSEF